MPYWKPSETKTDCKGVTITPGDILQNVDDTSPWKYFVCYQRGKLIEVRDLNANNVCMCDLGLGGDVVNIGHYTKNPGILNKEDLEHYFDVDENFNRINPDLDLTYEPTEAERKEALEQISKELKKMFSKFEAKDFSGETPFLKVIPAEDFCGQTITIPISYKGSK